MLLKDIIYKGKETVSVLYPEGEAREMVFAYLEDVFGIRRHDHILEPDRLLSDEDVRKAMADFRRMASGEPLQYITGVAHFYGRKFRVTPDVLIPRQETELLCNELILLSDGLYGNRGLETIGRNSEILDMCTGSGCIAWTLALEIPGAAVTALDISDGALAVASSQDFEEDISTTGALKPRFIKADVLQGPENSPEIFGSADSRTGKFDIIVSNPPYVMDSEQSGCGGCGSQRL